MKQRAILPVLTPIAEQEIPAVKGDTAKLLEELKGFLPPERLVTKPDDLFAYECDAQTFDRAELSSQGLRYERLDQLTIDILLGVR